MNYLTGQAKFKKAAREQVVILDILGGRGVTSSEGNCSFSFSRLPCCSFLFDQVENLVESFDRRAVTGMLLFSSLPPFQ